jgi:hypothetical protein
MSLRPLDDFLPAYEFSERHRIAIDAPAVRIDEAIRRVTLGEIPVAQALWFVRRLGRRTGDPTRPLLRALPGSLILDDVPGEGIVLGLTGRFWRLRGGAYGPEPRTPEEFGAIDRHGEAKAVIDFRIGPSRLSTETRVHVPDDASRRKFRRYWLVIRSFSGLIRILMLRAARRRALA